MNHLKFLQKFWLRSLIAVVLCFALVDQVYADVNGEYLVGLNITANGIEIKTGNLTIDSPGTILMSGATGPTPVAGGGNFAALAVNGTPVITAAQSTPTPFPTCAAGIILEGKGSNGINCGVAALTTATPAAGTYLYNSAGGAGSVIGFATPLPTSTPALTATPQPTATPQTVSSIVIFNTGNVQELFVNVIKYYGGSANGATTEADAETPMTQALTFTKMYVLVNPAITQTMTFTLRKNGANTAITCTISVAASCNDTTHSATYAAGDTWDVLQGSDTAADTSAVNIQIG